MIFLAVRGPRTYRLLCLCRGTFEGVFICEVEYHEHSVCFLVVAVGEGEEFLLACGIPDADGDFAAVDPHQLLLEAESQRGGVEMAEGG